jgi:hypothetical protein
MRLVYSPEGGDRQEWQVDLGRMRVAECEAIERRTGMPYGTTFKEKLLQGNTTARRALLWTMQRRTHHNLRYEDVDFADVEVLLELDRDELQRAYDELRDNVGLDDDMRQFQLAMIGAEIARLDADAEAGEQALEGKAPSTSSAAATG